MHFVSSQKGHEQISDIVSFFNEHLRASLDDSKATSAAFKDFEARMKELDSRRDYQGLLDYLLEVKGELLQLPTSHKSASLTIQRAVLLVLPLLKSQEGRVAKGKASYADLKRTTLGFCEMLEGAAEYPLSIKVNSVLHIFSIFDEKSAFKGLVFQRLFELCDKHGQLKIIVENLKKVEEISREWAMSLDERRELYRSCAVTLDRNNEPVAAFKVMMAYLKLFQKSGEAELAEHRTEQEAKRCVMLGVRVPTVIDFADVLQLAAVKHLSGKDKEVFDFMNLFTTTDSKQFAEKIR